MSDEKECHECGQSFKVDDNDIANHVDEDGEIDHDADADHVPFALEDDDDDNED